jgi:hypothetical protein
MHTVFQHFSHRSRNRIMRTATTSSLAEKQRVTPMRPVAFSTPRKMATVLDVCADRSWRRRTPTP